jgi:hypothetical protein
VVTRLRGRTTPRRHTRQRHTTLGIPLALVVLTHRTALDERPTRPTPRDRTRTTHAVLGHHPRIVVGGGHQLIGGLIHLIALRLELRHMPPVRLLGHLTGSDPLLLRSELLLPLVQRPVPVDGLIDQLHPLR